MKQITPEIKAKIFALYLTSQIHVDVMPDIDFLLHGVMMENNGYGVSVINEYQTELTKPHFFDLHNCKLWLRSLSSITDEDAIEVAKIEDNFEDPLRRGKALIRDFNHILWHQERWSEITDYLRSKGYALPALGYSVDELVEAGIFKLKEVNNDN